MKEARGMAVPGEEQSESALKITAPLVCLRFTIEVDVDAPDFQSAGKHQVSLEEYFGMLALKYPGAKLTVRERRPRNVNANARSREPRVRSGRAKTYE